MKNQPASMLKRISLLTLFIIPCLYCPAQSIFRLDAGAFKASAHKKFITQRPSDGFRFSFMPDTFGIRGSNFGWTFGYNFYYAWLGQLNVSDVPLESPVKNFANVKVRNDLGGMDLFLRFTNAIDGSDRLMAYADIGGGYRFSASRLTIRPQRHLEGYEEVSKEKLGSTSGFNFKAGFGLVYMIGDQIGLNAGAEWTHCGDKGETVDLGSVKKTGNYLEYCSTPQSYNIINIKLGFTFLMGERDPYGYVPPPYTPTVKTPTPETNPTTTEQFDSGSNSENSGSGCLSGFLGSIFSGCLFGGSSDNSSSSGPTSNSGSSGNSSNPRPNEIKIKKCCGEEK